LREIEELNQRQNTIKPDLREEKRYIRRPTDCIIVAAPSATPRAMRGQNPEVAGKEQAQRTRSNEILEYIKKLKDSYGQDKNKNAKVISYGAAARLF
jgi:hypothetical protein